MSKKPKRLTSCRVRYWLIPAQAGVRLLGFLGVSDKTPICYIKSPAFCAINQQKSNTTTYRCKNYNKINHKSY